MADATGLESQIPGIAIPRGTVTDSTNGLQSAHIFGNGFVNEEGMFLQALFPNSPPDGSWPWNFAELGETKGTAAAYGTSVHKGQESGAYDRLLYDPTPMTTTPQILNVLEEEFKFAGTDDAKLAIRQKAIALSYYMKRGQLDQSLLPDGQKTLAWNGSDYRIVTVGGQQYNLDNGADVTAYLQSQQQKYSGDLLEDPEYLKILDVVKSEVGAGWDYNSVSSSANLDRAMIDFDQEYARILFPEGKVYLNAEQLADISIRRVAAQANSSTDGKTLDYDAYTKFLDSDPAKALKTSYEKGFSDLIKAGKLQDLPSLTWDAASAELSTLTDPVGIEDVFAVAKDTAVLEEATPSLQDLVTAGQDPKAIDALKSGLTTLDAFEPTTPGKSTPDFAKLSGAYAEVSPLLSELKPVDLVRYASTASNLLLGAFELNLKYNEYGGFNEQYVDWLAESGTSLVVGGVILSVAESVLAVVPGGQVVLFAFGAKVGLDLIGTVANEILTTKTPDGQLVYPADGIAHAVATAVVAAVQLINSAVEAILKPVIDEILSFPVVQDALMAVSDFAHAVLSNIDFVAGNGAAVAQDGRWLIGQDNALLIGTDADDTLVELGFGTALGGGGDDFLVGWKGSVLKAGQKISPNDPNSATAQTDLHLTLDGGEGDDWIVAWGGKEAITVGGLGRDWILNTSAGGIIWGDVQNSILDTSTDQRYYLTTTTDGSGTSTKKNYIADDASNADNFSWAPNVTIEDPQRSDIITFFGIPLVGGADNGGIALSLAGFGLVGAAIGAAQTFVRPVDTIYVDQFLPFLTYKFEEQSDGSYDLLIGNVLTAFLDATEAVLGTNSGLSGKLKNYLGVERVKDYIPIKQDGIFAYSYGGVYQAALQGLGKLGLVFEKSNPIYAILAKLPETAITFALEGGGPLVDEVLTASAAVARFATALSWYGKNDPLVLDLGGQGLVTTRLDQSSVHFDFTDSFFAERTGWLSGDEGFLVLDRNGNGRIDDASELFGLATGSGFGDLAAYDLNHDGAIDANDAIFAKLQVWVDANGDGITDPGELHSLGDLGIVSISLNSIDLGNSTTSDGTTLLAAASFTYANGATGNIYDAVFPSDPTDTVYRGESGTPAWIASPIDARGFGHVTNLAIAAANDFDLAALLASTAAAMTTPDLKTLTDQAGAVLGRWGETLNLTRELDPVLLGTDATGKTVLLDRALYVEDASGGYWTLQSGNAVLDASGNPIARATMQQVLAQAVAAGEDWQIEQIWSPSSRATALQYRTDAPYLAQIVDGRAVILDYGIQNPDGSWSLASGNPVLDGNGVAIAAPTLADVLAQAPPSGDEWRAENIGFNPFAAIPVQNIGLDVINGVVVDYTVQLTDQDGTFYVWARNLDRALALQAKDGNARGFDLRNYEVKFADLEQQVEATDDSHYRIELLTPAEFNFALELDGVTFEPQLLAGSIDDGTGVITYSVNGFGQNSLSSTEYVSGIQQAIGLINEVFAEYVVVSRAAAVRIALQGGLSDYAQGITFDATVGKYVPTTNEQLAPMLEAIFNAAPADNTNNAIAIYLTKWNDILWQVYPDYRISAGDTVSGDSIPFDQVFLLQQFIEAAEHSTINYDIVGIANALSVDQTKIVTASPASVTVNGTAGTDYFYITPGNHTYVGGAGSDYYFVGVNPGNEVIVDYGKGEANELLFTSLNAGDVYAAREGEDLLLTVLATGSVIRLKDQFLGELNDYYSDGTQATSGVSSIVFSDGTVWDRFQMAVEVAHRTNGDISVIGSGSADVLWAGVGNQYLSGGAGGDIYIVEPGDGHTTIDDQGSASFGPIQAGLDLLDFRGGLTASNLRLTRQGSSDDLHISLLDANGQPTGDTVLIVNQFRDVVYNLSAFASLIGSSGSDDSLDYAAPDQIERFIFDDGTSLDFKQIIAQVIANNETSGDDVIYGSATNDTLDGGPGNDFLSGGSGSDTYIFGRGYGQDVVEDDDETSHFFGDPYTDVLQFKDALWSDLTFIRVGDSQDLTFQIAGTTDRVTIPDFTETDPLGFTQPNRIEQFVFSDGTIWGWQEALQHFIDVYATAGNDTLSGFGGLAEGLGFTFDGGAGNDLLQGHSGNDIYMFGRGYGNDTIFDLGGDDTLILKGLASSDVSFSRTALDLIITINDTGETITLRDQYVRAGEQENAIEHFQFTDTTLDYTQFNPDRMPVVTTIFGETLEGSDFAETLDGRGGNATLIGHDGGDTYTFDIGYGAETIIDRRTQASWDDRPHVKVPVDDSVQFGKTITRDNVIFTKDGNDLLISFKGYTDTLRIQNQFRSLDDQVEYFKFYDNSDGTPDYLTANDLAQLLQVAAGNIGDNLIVGLPTQPNVLDGGPGDDTLVGGTAADTYVFSAGYGFDLIEEAPDAPGVNDQVVFGATVNPAQIKLTRNGTDLSIDLGNGTDVLTIQDGLGTHGVERYLFADGTTWTLEDIKTRLLIGTDGDDQIIGFDGRNDVLDGGKGSDYLAGGTGDDTYLFGFGDGQDAIFDTAGKDTLEFKAGVTQDKVTFFIDGTNLIAKLSTGDSIVIQGGVGANPVENFVFDNGNGGTLSLAQVQAGILAAQASVHNQFIDLNLIGDGATTNATGSDLISVSEASVVTFRSGDGSVQISVPATSWGWWWWGGPHVTDYTIDFPDFASSQVAVSSVDANSGDVLLTFTTGDRLYLPGVTNDTTAVTLHFADGSTWSNAQVGAALIAAEVAAKAPLILGTPGDDVIDAGPGTHEVVGNGGNDTFLFHKGDGSQTISDTSNVANVLKVTGYTATDVTAHKLATDQNSIVLTFAGSTDQVTLIYDGARNGVTGIVFGDGTALSQSQLFVSLVGVGTGGDDLLVGTPADEVFDGGPGNDIIVGGGGNDIFLFNRGDGQDTIKSGGSADGEGIVQFGAGIARADVVASRDTGGNVILGIAGTTDSITLVTPTSGWNAVISHVQFADGSVWSYTDIARSIAVSDDGNRISIPSGDGTGVAGVSITGGDGNDFIQGGNGGDILVGGKGDDTLSGGPGSDTYYFALGDGQDTIVDNGGTASNETNRLVFGAGITRSDVSFADVNGRDLVIKVGAGNDRITVKDMFDNASDVIEQFVFADGTILTLPDILTAIHPAAPANHGTPVADLAADFSLSANPNGAWSYGEGYGGSSFTPFTTTGSYGGSVQYWQNAYGAPPLVGENLSATAVAYGTAVVPGDTFIMHPGSSDDAVTRWTAATAGDYDYSGSFALADVNPTGVVGEVFHNGVQLYSGALGGPGAVYPSTGQSEVFHGNVYLNAGDTLSFVVNNGGFYYDDTTAVSAQISLVSTADVLPDLAPVGLTVESTGLIDPPSSVVGSASLVGDGEYQLTPNSYFEAGAIWGQADLSKNIVWRTQMYFGSDTGGADGISFALQDAGPTALGGAGNGLGALVSGSFGIAFDTHSNYPEPGANFVEFTLNGNRDDTSFDPFHTVGQLDDAAWHNVDITWNAATATLSASIDGVVIASKSYDTVNNLFGGQTKVYYGFGAGTGYLTNDQRVRILGTTSSVPVEYLSVSHDAAAGTVIGSLQGIDPNVGDTFSYSIVDGNGQAAADPVFEIVGGDQLAVKIGAVFDDASVDAHTLNILVTDKAGATYEQALTVRFDVPAGPATGAVPVPPTILGTTGNDRIVGSNGNSRLSGGYGDDTLQGGDDAWLNYGNDTFDGGPGNDQLFGGRGDDTYLFGRGDGDDVITEAGGTNTIVFGAGIAAGDIAVSQVNGTDIKLKLDGGDGSITIKNALSGGAASVIQKFAFADGSSWQWADVAGLSQQGGGGDDALQGLALPVGTGAENLIYNGSFETFTLGQYGSYVVQSLPGWVAAGGTSITVVSNYYGLSAANDGQYSLEIDQYGGTSDVSQQIADLSAGEALLLQFDHAGYQGSFQVYWNDQLVDTVTESYQSNSAAEHILLTAQDGTNSLRFVGTSTEYYYTSAIDNVRLYALGSQAPVYADGTQPQMGDTVVQPGTNQPGVLYTAIEAGALAASPNLVVNGTFQTPDPFAINPYSEQGYVSTSNVPGWVDANGTPFDIQTVPDSGLPAADTQFVFVDDGGDGLDLSQTIGGGVAGQNLLLQFDYGGQYFTYGTFDVYWDGVLVSTILSTPGGVQDRWRPGRSPGWRQRPAHRGRRRADLLRVRPELHVLRQRRADQRDAAGGRLRQHRRGARLHSRGGCPRGTTDRG